MLIFEAEGYLEVEAKDIVHLSRSVATVCFGDSGQAGFNIHATLCLFHDGSQERCVAAFHSKVLKRALVFSVKPPENTAALQNGEDVLAELGFSLEKVNLQLSPAMLEVVLKDVPGIATPAEARKLRRERELLLSELRKEVDSDPDGPLGAKSALKLSSEKRLDERSLELQKILTDLLSPQEIGDGYSAAMAQVKDISQRLEKAEALLEEERKQREFSETITAAAEKRIRELEEILVDVETKSAGELKEKQRVVKLKTRVHELEEQLEHAVQALDTEKSNQEKFVADVKSANSQIAALEEKLRQSEVTLAGTLDRLADVENRNEQLKNHILELESELENTSAAATQLGEAETLCQDLREELVAARGALADSQAENQTLTNKVSVAEEKLQVLQDELKNAEVQAVAPVENAELERLQNDLNSSAEEMARLQEELQREQSVRNRLEKGALEDDKRIRELEESLERLQRDAGTETADKSSGALEALKSELHEQKRRLLEEQGAREALETELEQSHKMVDSLEKMLRETSHGKGQNAEALADKEKEIVKLETKIELLNEQLEQERARQDQLVQAAAQNIAAAEDDTAEKRRPLKKMVTMSIDPNLEAAQPKTPSKPAKPLPHELRPEPNKGDFFRPDWDLQGLPCATADQVFKAWETVFNVQIALDGYPTQFCMAFLVVLKVGNLKQLFMVFRLKQTKYTLVKVPVKSPKNEDELKKAIDESLRFLRSCGFEMEEMPKEYIENTLGTYFLEK